MKNILLTLFALTLTCSISAQDCSPWYPMESGAVMELTSFDTKGNPSGKSVQTIIDKKGDANELEAKVKSEFYDKKDKLVMTQTYSLHCKHGNFYVDMESLMSPEIFGAYENMEVEVNTEDLQFPAEAKAGTSLPDGVLTAKISSGGMAIMTLQIQVTDRKVEGVEKITTAAGTFDCIKLSQTVETKSVIKTSIRSVDWYARDTGPVRSESFNKSGKSMGYTELTSLKRT